MDGALNFDFELLDVNIFLKLGFSIINMAVACAMLYYLGVNI